MTPDQVTQSMCGVANLLAVMFRKDPDEVKVKLGVQVSTCFNCGKAYIARSHTRYHELQYCSYKCWQQSIWIEVECPVCKRHFKRRKGRLLRDLSKGGQQHIFCSKKCLGSWTGRTYGFGVHQKRGVPYPFRCSSCGKSMRRNWIFCPWCASTKKEAK